MTLLAGFLHLVTYAMKTEKCQCCNNFTDSWVVVAFHITNFIFWYLLAACVLIKQKEQRIYFLLIQSLASFLLMTEFVGHPKDWRVWEAAGFLLAGLHPFIKRDWLLIMWRRLNKK